ncbi:MAG TPA: DNA repair protein RadA [Candidatus Limnocylindrales bacterium]|nr:DNA repair protein RadA [Candidatus Limnocylindrales bacterium]
MFYLIHSLSKSHTYFACQNCGYKSPKWMGRCPDCGEWNSLVEERVESVSPVRNTGTKVSYRSEPIPITEIKIKESIRLSCAIEEFDRVLGGGIIPGSVILIGGDPGIGKSTLLLQATGGLSSRGLKILYVSGEESAEQTKLRGDRLGISHRNLYILTETCLEEIFRQVERLKPDILVIDSIQTMFTSALQSAQGSVSQVREVAAQLMHLSKRTNLSTFIVGHVTKTGAIAGPRVLEHIVDTVLYFEGERNHPYRILRAVKNRFGSTNEIGVFEMKSSGLVEVSNPSELFLSERPSDRVSGSVVVSSIEGTRPILIELQALVAPSNLGVPRRMTKGVDANRVSLLMAVLEKRVGLFLQSQDIFVNIAGGVKVDEPAVDLGLTAAVASSFKNIPIDRKTVVIGEVGLAGEVRAVTHIESRLREAEKLGFTRCVIPRNSLDRLIDSFNIETEGVSSVEEAFEVLLG